MWRCDDRTQAPPTAGLPATAPHLPAHEQGAGVGLPQDERPHRGQVAHRRRFPQTGADAAARTPGPQIGQAVHRAAAVSARRAGRGRRCLPRRAAESPAAVPQSGRLPRHHRPNRGRAATGARGDRRRAAAKRLGRSRSSFTRTSTPTRAGPNARSPSWSCNRARRPKSNCLSGYLLLCNRFATDAANAII